MKCSLLHPVKVNSHKLQRVTTLYTLLCGCVGGPSGCRKTYVQGSCRERQLAIMQLSEPDVGSIEKGSIVFVAHAGCAADVGVVDAWERRGSERVTRSI